MQKLLTPYAANPGTSSNWTGRTPRTMQEAFPQYPGCGYEDPPLTSKIGDAIAIALVVAVFGAVAYIGPSLFWG